MDEIDYHERMAQRGTYVEYDLFGQEAPNSSMPMYKQESATIRELIERGFLEKILISQDVCYKKCLIKNGGWGYAHILNNVVPRFKENGITDEEIRTIMVENPKRVLPFH
jgi:phosphotriesterase-related protein